MEIRPRNVRTLILDNGRCPFDEWLDSLRDASFVRAVDARLTRVRDGNFGDHKSVGEGVLELRVSKGPGLRIYYGLDGDTLVILLGGGDKSSQNQDISKAQELWREYKSSKEDIRLEKYREEGSR